MGSRSNEEGTKEEREQADNVHKNKKIIETMQNKNSRHRWHSGRQQLEKYYEKETITQMVTITKNCTNEIEGVTQKPSIDSDDDDTKVNNK